mgnify:CR=1 FL=1
MQISGSCHLLSISLIRYPLGIASLVGAGFKPAPTLRGEQNASKHFLGMNPPAGWRDAGVPSKGLFLQAKATLAGV